MPIEPGKRPRTSAQAGLGNPGQRVFPITPADAELPEYTTALFVETAGNLVFIPIENTDGEIITWAVAAGSYHPVSVRQVRAATTATVYGIRG